MRMRGECVSGKAAQDVVVRKEVMKKNEVT